MPNRPALVSQIDVKRAVAGAQAAGLRIGRVEVDHKTGRVIIWPEGAKDDGPDDWDRRLKTK